MGSASMSTVTRPRLVRSRRSAIACRLVLALALAAVLFLLLHAVDEEGRVVDEAFCAGEGRLDANGLPRAEGDETGEIDNRRAT